MGFRDIFSLAWRTVRGNKLRTGLTVTIIAFGIMALVGIITAIKAMNQKFTESFTNMGANSFTIRFRERTIKFGGPSNRRQVQLSKKSARKEKTSNLGKEITKDQAELFIRQYSYPSVTGISVFGSRNSIASYAEKKTSPNVMVMGGDENYVALNGMAIQDGRNFTRGEVQSGTDLCLLGFDVANKLFPNQPARAVNASIRINNVPFRVAGVLESRGSTFGFSRDNLIITSYNSIEKHFSSGNSYVIAVMTGDLLRMEQAMGEAEAAFRPIRKLTTTEESNFALDRSDSVAETAMKSLGFLTISATVIGLITLIGAAIGLMNIMLVSVSERTKEVGLVKAIGGKSKMVQRQFLLEAMIISLLGAVFGIVLGVCVGNLFAVYLGTGFVVPWNWVAGGIILCAAVGLSAGIYPAIKAGRLNPIAALRYE
ncbi:MAG: FtsX-like permease family protein [Chitinophagaceae bacterium]|nr:MAG: FtsX-like permease family protein [Chitinophagaceae bacterium]